MAWINIQSYCSQGATWPLTADQSEIERVELAAAARLLTLAARLQRLQSVILRLQLGLGLGSKIMYSTHHGVIVLVLWTYLVLFASQCQGHTNLFMDERETKRLLGETNFNFCAIYVEFC